MHTMKAPPNRSPWPEEGGGSLLLVVPGIQLADADHLGHELDQLGRSLGVAVEHGSQHVVAEVRTGMGAVPWIAPHAVFVFRCPDTLSVNEAAPLLQTGLGVLSPQQMEAALAVILGCVGRALKWAPRVGVVHAHAWDPGDDVRFASGTVQEFELFLRSPSAWCWEFLGTGNEYLSVSRDENPFWFEVRRV